MKLVFDPPKRALNIAKHGGLDFVDLDWKFFERSEILPAKRDRYMAIGPFRDDVITVIFSRLGREGLSIISMRPASEKEKRRYDDVRPKSSPEREAEIQRMIASDPDAPEATDEQLSASRPFRDVFPDLYESIQRSRGRPPVESPRRQISIRLDADVIDKFKATGKGWQSRINEVLKRASV